MTDRLCSKESLSLDVLQQHREATTKTRVMGNGEPHSIGKAPVPKMMNSISTKNEKSKNE